MALTIFIFVMIAVAFLLLFSWGGPLVAIVKLAILLFFVPVLVRYIRRARPGTYDPLALPADVLPAQRPRRGKTRWLKSLEGGCSCGAVRFRLTAGPMFVHCCHCLDCQQQTGSAFAINALNETDRIEMLAGTPEPVSMPTDSGRPHDIYRCPSARWPCGATTAAGRICASCASARSTTRTAIMPDVHIYTRSKLPWVALPADVPAFAEFYDMKTLWPAEAQERRRAASAAARG